MSRRAAVPALALVLLASSPVSPASAHTVLSGSVPAAGSTTPAPEQVVLSFSGEVLERLSTVTVVGPDGADAAEGAPVLEGTDVVQPLDGPLEAGPWTVSYRVVAADGHPLTGQLGFTVAGARPGAVPTPTPAAPRALPSATAPPRADGDSAPPVLVGGLLAGAAGGAAALLLVLRRRTRRG